jgi:hypothetical protein
MSKVFLSFLKRLVERNEKVPFLSTLWQQRKTRQNAGLRNKV